MSFIGGSFDELTADGLRVGDAGDVQRARTSFLGFFRFFDSNGVPKKGKETLHTIPKRQY